jgi:hypothetical protein
MAHHDRVALAGLGDVHPDPVGIDEAMAELAHIGSFMGITSRINLGSRLAKASGQPFDK